MSANMVVYVLRRTHLYGIFQGRLQECAACAAAQGAESIGTAIPNHKFENSRALYGCRPEHNRKESEGIES
jgi:hypothetical protein